MGLLLLNSELIRALALSLKDLILSGTLMLSSFSSSGLESLFSTSFGRLLNLSVLDDTNIGVLPGGPGGNLGGAISGILLSVTGTSSCLSSFPLLLNCLSLCLWRSLSLARKGDGLRNLRLVIIDG